MEILMFCFKLCHANGPHARHAVMEKNKFFDPFRRRKAHTLSQRFAFKRTAQIKDFVKIFTTRIRRTKPALFMPHNKLI